MADVFWASGKRHERRLCLSCGRAVTARPSPDCGEPRHSTFHEHRREQNNRLRREARLAARQAGTVKRYGSPEAKKAQTKRAYQKRRLAIIARMGGACMACGHADHRALQVHHLEGGGGVEREMKGWRYHLDMALMSASQLLARYRLLCANCHQVAHYEAGEDPS